MGNLKYHFSNIDILNFGTINQMIIGLLLTNEGR